MSNPLRIHLWTDEDRAFAAAQWASGITQREIGAIFGYPNSVAVNIEINTFMLKYSDLPVRKTSRGQERIPQSAERMAAVRGAIAKFAANR